VRCSGNFPESFQKALEILSKRWTGLLLFVLGQGPLRFNEIAAQIGVISDRMLSERLKELEAEGIVERRIFAEVPVRVEYRLTDKGVALVPIYEAIGGWAARWIDGIDEAACHASRSEGEIGVVPLTPGRLVASPVGSHPAARSRRTP
jgi:DNA-binding HxlR family transcriptional regulator